MGGNTTTGKIENRVGEGTVQKYINQEGTTTKKQVLFIRVIFIQMYNKFRVPGYSSSESYGETQKMIGFKGSRAHRSKLGS